MVKKLLFIGGAACFLLALFKVHPSFSLLYLGLLLDSVGLAL